MRATSKLAVALLGMLLVSAYTAHAARAAISKPAAAAEETCKEDADCSERDYCDDDDGVCTRRIKDYKECDRDAQCRSNACREISFLGPMQKICVEACDASADCPKDTPICLNGSGMLRNANGGDPGKDTKGSGMCVECKADADCKADEYCIVGWSRDAWTCNSMGHKCDSYNDCDKGQFCDMSKGRCRSWGSAADVKSLLA